MLITELTPSHQIAVKCNYSKSYVSRFRALETAFFDRQREKWVFDPKEIDDYCELFRGEIVWKTPLWVIKNEPIPDMKAMYEVDEIMQIPASKISLYDYQRFGVRFMNKKLKDFGFVINADDVGLGKSAQTILTMKHLIEHEGVERVIVACKKSIKRQWVQEIKKFTDIDESFAIMTADGTKKQREKIYEAFNQELCGILVMNYHLIMNDIDLLTSLGFDLLVVDEAHCIKARTGKLNKAMAELGKRVHYTIFLTGTPVMSRPDDVFGIIQIADPKYFGKWKAFEKKHIFREAGPGFMKDVGYLELDELREKVQDVIIRRTEFEVSVELPSTVIKVITCDKDKTQLEIEKAIQTKRRSLMEERDKLIAKVNKTDVDNQKIEQTEGMIKGLIAADQACANDPSLFRHSRSKMMQKEFGSLVPDSYDISHKTQTLCDLVETILDADEKVVIFSKFETSAQLMKQEIERQLKAPVLLYTGKIDDETRDNNLDLFKETDQYNILIGTEAMSEGLNLQVARHLIHYDQADTPAIKTQRNGRVRRVGSQYGAIYVYDLITEESKDVERLANIEKKMGLVDGVVSIDQAQSESLKEAMKAS